MTESDQLAEAFDQGRRYQAEGCAGDGCIACAAWVRSFKAGGFAPTGGWQEGDGDSNAERGLAMIGDMTAAALAPADGKTP